AARVRYDEQLSYGQDTDIAIRLCAAGAYLKMLPKPSAVWRDHDVTGRVSSQINAEQRMERLEQVRPLITERASWSQPGRTVAKAKARQDQRFTALCLYAAALVRGAYSPRSAVVAFLQVLLGPSQYRITANLLARLGISP